MTNTPTDEFDELVGATPRGPLVEARSRIDEWWDARMLEPVWYRAWHWGVPAIVLLVASITRLWNLGAPRALVFDETFYVKDAWTLWNLGYEAQWSAEADALFAAGNSNVFTTDPSFVVHPPLGKWLIALGMAAFGPENPVGWRISTALVGILAVVLIMLIAKKLMHSTLLAGLAGGLLAIDGNAIVMSRVAILDNFVMIFVLLGFGALLLDREWSINRLTQKVRERPESTWGPVLLWRPWMLAMGLSLGLAAAVKWNGLYFLAFFALYTVVTDALTRRRLGVPFWLSGTLLRQAPVSFLLSVPIALVAYLSTWVRWFQTEGGYYRQWATEPGNAWTGFLDWVPLSIQSFVHFEQSVYNYHVGESRPHSYQANPLTWLLLVRPTSMYYKGSELGENGCLADSCGISITGISNPIIWWAATAACGYLVYRLIRQREWQVGVILLGVAAGYLPWLMYLNRTVFQFYTVVFEPFMILALVFALGRLLGSRDDPAWLRNRGFALIGGFVVVCIAVSVYFWPLWAGVQLEYHYLASHWWLPTWR